MINVSEQEPNPGQELSNDNLRALLAPDAEPVQQIEGRLSDLYGHLK
jgi:hypothetical protein